jgi:hypothetical protein
MAAQVGYDFERSLSATSSLDSTAYGNATLPARKNTAASGYASPTHGGQGTTAEGSGTSSTTSSHKNRRDEGSHYNAEDKEDYITSSSSSSSYYLVEQRYTTSDCRLHEPRVWEVMRIRGEGAPGTLQRSGIKKKTLPEGGEAIASLAPSSPPTRRGASLSPAPAAALSQALGSQEETLPSSARLSQLREDITISGAGRSFWSAGGEGGRSRTCCLASDLEEPRRHVTLKRGLLSTRLMSW